MIKLVEKVIGVYEKIFFISIGFMTLAKLNGAGFSWLWFLAPFIISVLFVLCVYCWVHTTQIKK